MRPLAALLLVACSSPTLPPDAGPGAEICNNGRDDNGDHKTDCDDPQCFGDPSCTVNPVEICDDGLDNDHNGATDCADAACATFPACLDAGGGPADSGSGGGAGGAGGSGGGAMGPVENCSNGIDDDGDRAVDCGDTDCAAAAACANLNDGSACTADAQCLGGLCRTEAAWGFPNGSCTSATCNCHGGICVNGACEVSCTGVGACRPGYACATGGSCVPLCTSDTDCSTTCNPYSKRCGPPDQGLAKYGQPCTSYTQCETGQCFAGTDPNWPGGYCAGLCRGDLKSCGPGGYCSFDAASGFNTGFCVEGCGTLGGICRTQGGVDYTCIVDPHNSAGAYCRCKAHSETCGSGAECCSGTCSGTSCS